MTEAETLADGVSAAATPVRLRRLWPALLPATALVLLLGAVEDWFGKTDSGDVYGSDAVQYLDCARAIARGDWRSALNPLWSQGYPALLTLLRPAFKAGLWGDWDAIRTLNLLIVVMCWAAFCWLVLELLHSRLGQQVQRRGAPLMLGGALGTFLTTQVCLGQVSRVGPDELLATIFFAVCAVLLRLLARPSFRLAAVLGLLLGLGFLVKAAFLLLGVLFLAVVSAALAWKRERGWLRSLAASVLVFGAIACTYAAALSGAVGRRTFGEAGAINYAWHVDRLAKWVHWEGGIDPADKAWPKPAIARFAQWQTNPPDFGRPLHPSVLVGTAPRLYVFQAPVIATYVPYFDPPYWYEGYKHVFRWRYQVIALAKSLSDLAQVLLRQPFLYALALVLRLLAPGRQGMIRLQTVWPLGGCALLAVAIFLPVHLEGRYLSGALAVLCLLALTAACGSGRLRGWRAGACAVLLIFGAGLGVVKTQHEAWSRARDGWSPAQNVEWRTGNAVSAAGLPAGVEVGMISWQPNLHCDWAYMAGVRITSEIADGNDERAFWMLPLAGQQAVLAEFRHAGAAAVLTWDRPQGAAPGWRQLPGSTMWIYRF